MAEKMSLENVLRAAFDALHVSAPIPEVKRHQPDADRKHHEAHQAVREYLDAHLTQQAVDVGAIQRVIDELRGYCDASEDAFYGTLSTSLVREYADKLTAALPKDSNGAEGMNTQLKGDNA